MIDDTRIITSSVEREDLSRSYRAQTWSVHIVDRVGIGIELQKRLA